MGSIKGRQLSAATYASCLIAWLILCSPWLFGDMTIPYDAKAHFHAQLQFLAHAIHSGQSPFWNPNTFAGSPQIADPQSLIFSPAVLIALVNPAPGLGAVDALAFGLLAVAALSVLAFFLDRGWHPLGGAVAAIAFSFGASAAWRIQHIGQIQSYALFAVSLWLLGRTLDRKSMGWGAALGAIVGLMVIEPDQVALLGCYILAGYVAAHLLAQEQWPTAARQVARPLLAAAAVATILAIIPIALTYLFIGDSNRPEVPLAEATRSSLHPASLLTALVGDLFGAHDPKVEYWGPYSVSWDPNNLSLSQNMGQLYIGSLPIVLLLTLGLVRGQVWRREIRYMSIALAAMILYGLGSFTPVFEFIYDTMPGVDLFRRPADATFMIGGLAAIVGGYLVHLLVSGQVPPATRRQVLCERAVLSGAILIAVAVAWRAGHLGDALRPILLAALSLGLAVATAEVIMRMKARSPIAMVAAVVGVMTGDMALNNGPNESTALPATNYEFLNPQCRNEVIKFVKSALARPAGSPRRDRVELAGLGFDWPNAGLVHGFDHSLGYNPVRMEAATKVLGAGDTIAGWDQRQFTPLFPSYRSTMADLLGLRFIATPIPIEKIDGALKPGDLRLRARTKEAFIYENPRALPRAMFVEKWLKADFEQLTETGQWPEFDPRTTVLLETEFPAIGGAASPVEAATANASMPTYENTRVEIDVAAPRAGFVLLNDLWHPWWQATIDGRPAEILKANVIFRAVQVPAGAHRIVFEFEPLNGAIAEIERKASSVLMAGSPKVKKRPRT